MTLRYAQPDDESVAAEAGAVSNTITDTVNAQEPSDTRKALQ